MSYDIELRDPAADDVGAIHTLSGAVDSKAEIYLTLPEHLYNTDGTISAPKDGCILEVKGMKTLSNIHIYFQKFRVGIDKELHVDVINPYPWSRRKLESKHPVNYVSRRGVLESLFHIIGLILTKHKGKESD